MLPTGRWTVHTDDADAISPIFQINMLQHLGLLIAVDVKPIGSQFRFRYAISKL